MKFMAKVKRRNYDRDLVRQVVREIDEACKRNEQVVLSMRWWEKNDA